MATFKSNRLLKQTTLSLIVTGNMLSLRRIATTAAPAVGRQGLQATSARIRLYSQDSQNSQAPQNSQASQDSQDSQADPYYQPPKYPNAVGLAYDLHHPRRPNTTWREDPILFLHGLFGSKKNNRTISKFVITIRCQ